MITFLNLVFGFRDFLHGVAEISIRLLGLVRSMGETILKVLLWRWKEKQKKKLRDMQMSLKRDTRS